VLHALAFKRLELNLLTLTKIFIWLQFCVTHLIVYLPNVYEFNQNDIVDKNKEIPLIKHFQEMLLSFALAL
jgi:hypothetical protein